MHALSAPDDGPRRILLVDDEPDILESLKELLESSLENVAVVTAISGDEAMKILGSQRLHLLVTDYKMPGMNGMELLRKARDAAPQVPRILMTAFPDLQIAIEAINDARIENFFTKPLDPGEVVEVLDAMLRHRQQTTQRDRAFARAMDMARRSKGKGEDKA